MKKTVLYFAALICMMMQTIPTFASDRVIPVNQLPAAAKTFVQKDVPQPNYLQRRDRLR